jgi:DNA-binding transcriptional MerR regulator
MDSSNALSLKEFLSNKEGRHVGMFRIGDFSQLGQVSVRTLRLYDEMGLLKPAQVDDFTDYRYYSLEQLPHLNRIVALKDLGFSLKEVAEFVEENVSLEDLRKMLGRKQDEVTQKLYEEQTRLHRLEARLKQIELENAPLNYDVTIKKVPAATIFSKRNFVPNLEDMDKYCTRFYNELYEVINAQKLNVIAPEFTLFHLREYVTENVDVEVCVVLDSESLGKLELPSDDSFTVRKLQGYKTVASIVYNGLYRELDGPARAITLWVGINGYHSVGAAREVHLSGPIVETGKEKAVVLELQVPVEQH